MAQEFKLKGVTSLNLKNGDKQEVEVEGVEGGKVLLYKVQDTVHAASANCTHYGAPLAKGVLTPEGRLTCPWHGGTLFELFKLSLLLISTSVLQCFHGRCGKRTSIRSTHQI